jgi:hypothetical protein
MKVDWSAICRVCRRFLGQRNSKLTDQLPDTLRRTSAAAFRKPDVSASSSGVGKKVIRRSRPINKCLVVVLPPKSVLTGY